MKQDILELSEQIKPRMMIKAIIHRENGSHTEIFLHSRIDTVNELDYYKHGGILQHVIRGCCNCLFYSDNRR
jgi:aconitate hydratase